MLSMHLFYLFLQNIKQIADKLRRQRNLMYRLELASDIYLLDNIFCRFTYSRDITYVIYVSAYSWKKNKLGYSECG